MLIILEIIHKNRLTGDFMKLDENDYPMTYKEYEKRVVELLLEDYTGDDLQLMIDKVDRELAKEPNYIEGFYGHGLFSL